MRATGARRPARVPVTTPIYTASSFFYDTTEELDRVFGMEQPGYSYARYDNPTAAALEELVTALEGGHGALACASGMAAVQMAVETALADRRKSVVAADALYGASTKLLLNVLEPRGVEVRFVDICDLDAAERGGRRGQAGMHPDGDHLESAAARGRDRQDRRNRARRRRRPGGR